MAETLTGTTPVSGRRTPGTFETFRAAALFASSLQPSGSPSSAQVRHVVATTMRRLGSGGCTARTAAEFGDHPDTAAVRMRWALAAIRAAYPAATPAPGQRPLVFAS
jgi:hypothetical protein